MTDPHELLSKLSKGEIDWRDALKALETLPKPWHTKEWKAKRKEKLGSACENCGTTQPPLVMQHTWHPTRVEFLFKRERQPYAEQWKEWREDHPIQVDSSHLLPDADGCPKCESTTIRYRMRAATWICVHKPKGLTCGHVFTTPVRVVSNAAVHELELAARKVVQEAFDDQYGIGKRVATIALQHHLQYISLANTKTLCKRCAFVEDRTDMVLCSECKRNYHSKSFPRCAACSGIDNSKVKAFYAFLNGRSGPALEK